MIQPLKQKIQACKQLKPRQAFGAVLAYLAAMSKYSSEELERRKPESTLYLPSAEGRICFQKPGHEVLFQAKAEHPLRPPPWLLQLLSSHPSRCYCSSFSFSSSLSLSSCSSLPSLSHPPCHHLSIFPFLPPSASLPDPIQSIPVY